MLAFTCLSETAQKCGYSNNRIQFQCADLTTLKTVWEPKFTVIIVFLLVDMVDRYKELLIAHYNRGARIVALTFSLESRIGEIKLAQRDDVDSIYIYSK